jgi:hypothetical protein
MKSLIIDNEFIKIESEEGIIIGTLKLDTLDIDLAKKIVALRLEVTEKEDYPTLINMKRTKKFSKEARDFLAGEKGVERVIAAALVIDSMLTATLANFFLKVNKPMVATKLFTNEEEAMQWLKTIKKSNPIKSTVSV